MMPDNGSCNIAWDRLVACWIFTAG